jgi:DNA polymerase-4
MALYSEVSHSVMALFRSITPLVEPLSLDEAFLDVSGSGRRLGDAAQIGEYLRARVFDEQGITCSVGVAGTKFVAKLASTSAKPDGLRVVRPPEVMDFLHPLPVGALWGVGPKTEEVLLRLGLRTVGDLAHVPGKTLQRALGSAAGTHLHELAWGRDPRRVVPNEPEKSAGHEETFGTDVDDPQVIHRELLLLSERTAGRLRAGGWLACTVSIKVRFADFATITRSRTLDVPTDVGQELYDTARALYDALGLERARIRLVGVRAERLIDADSASQQLELGAREHGRRDAELAVDRAARRFGAGAVRPATLLHRGGRPGMSAAGPTRPNRGGSRRPVPESPAGDPG